MPCPKCGDPLCNGHCPKCNNFNSAHATAKPTSTISTTAAQCQHCGHMVCGIKNRCHHCNSILKCDLCKNDIEKFVLTEVNPLPLVDCEKPYGNFRIEQIIQESAPFLEFKDYFNLSLTNHHIYNAVHSPPVNRNYRSTIQTDSGCVIASNGEIFEGVRIEHVCKTCLNKIEVISFTNCKIEGALPTMQNLKKLSLSRCKLSSILPTMRIDELHLDRCEFSMDVIAFISRVTIVGRIIWEFVPKDIDEIIRNLKQMGNRKIIIIIRAHDSMISNENWGSLLSEAVVSNDITLVRWQHGFWRNSLRLTMTYYLPGEKHKYYCTTCWRGFDISRTVCNGLLEVDGKQATCQSEKFYTLNNGKLESYVPDQLTPIHNFDSTTTSVLKQPEKKRHRREAAPIYHDAPRQVPSMQDKDIDLVGKQEMIAIYEKHKNIAIMKYDLKGWQNLMELWLDCVNSQHYQEEEQRNQQQAQVRHFISPPCPAQPSPAPTHHPMDHRGLSQRSSEQQERQAIQPATTTTSASLEVQPPNEKRKI